MHQDQVSALSNRQRAHCDRNITACPARPKFALLQKLLRLCADRKNEDESDLAFFRGALACSGSDNGGHFWHQLEIRHYWTLNLYMEQLASLYQGDNVGGEKSVLCAFALETLNGQV